MGNLLLKLADALFICFERGGSFITDALSVLTQPGIQRGVAYTELRGNGRNG